MLTNLGSRYLCWKWPSAPKGKLILSDLLSQERRSYSRPSTPKIKVVKKLDALTDSLAQKGFLRPYKPYVPPMDISKRVHAICDQLKMSFDVDKNFSNIKEKYNFLNECSEVFNATIPNSQISDIQNIGDAISFYETPIITTVPYDELKCINLPENLYIQYDYVRFDGDEGAFSGHTAFPKSSTLVTGLKYRGKYKGYEAKRSWP